MVCHCPSFFLYTEAPVFFGGLLSKNWVWSTRLSFQTVTRPGWSGLLGLLRCTFCWLKDESWQPSLLFSGMSVPPEIGTYLLNLFCFFSSYSNKYICYWAQLPDVLTRVFPHRNKKPINKLSIKPSRAFTSNAHIYRIAAINWGSSWGCVYRPQSSFPMSPHQGYFTKRASCSLKNEA